MAEKDSIKQKEIVQKNKEYLEYFEHFEFDPIDENNIEIIIDGLPIVRVNYNKGDYLKLASETGAFYRRLKKFEMEKEFYKPKFIKSIILHIKANFDKKKGNTLKKKEKTIEIDEDIKTWEQLEEIVKEEFSKDRINDFLVIQSVIISKWFTKNESIYMILVDSAGRGKSMSLRCFRDSGLTHFEDDFTANSFIVGKAKEKDKVHHLFNLMNNNTFIVQDLSGFLGSKRDKINTALSTLIGAFSEPTYSKFSPGAGHLELDSKFHIIWAMTDEDYVDRWEKIKHRARDKFLVYVQSEINLEKIYDKDSNWERVKKANLGFLKHLKERFENLGKFEIEISQEIKDHIKRFLKLRSYYMLVEENSFDGRISYHYKDNLRPTGWNRPKNQMMALLKAICLIKNKNEVDIEDVDLLKPFFIGYDIINPIIIQRKLNKVKDKILNFDNDNEKYDLFNVVSEKLLKGFENKINIEELEIQTNGLDYEKL